ncbi:phosphatidate cytidylyltransferase [bacterium]|jgi:phosphatidate cytidylyltransferase|nr:phosphatidate cytidylyltransferase [bacterium]MBT5015048.1 phosphatidate cytidylyltransferase [bacterium]
MNNFIVRNVTGVIYGLIFWATYIYFPLCFSFLLAAVALASIVFEWKNFFKPDTLAFWLLLPVYPVLPFVLLIYMNQIAHLRILLFLLFVLAFSFDTGCYFIGKLFGRHKILPSVSPGKSWEGFIGGYIFACFGMWLVCWIHQCTGSIFILAAITLALSFALLFGDLFESKLKRLANIKDSGTLMPGHGGFLDRFDGILFATYFIFLFRNQLLQLLS